MNIKGHGVTIIPPPGGSVFTAILTDLDIVGRYVFNVVLPFRLSAVYYVDPIRSVLDIRVLLYGVALAGLIAATVYLAATRRRAVFGWLWFFGALGPNLNLIAIPHLMQDRYLYLSMPGLLLVLAEVVAGLHARAVARGWNKQRTAYGLAVTARTYVAALAVLALMRGAVWSNMVAVFQDAVNKQPQAIFARYGLGNAYAQIWEDTRRKPKADPAKVEVLRQRWLDEWKIGVDSCPDAWRYACYLVMALNAGERAYKHDGNLAEAEHYWAIACDQPREASDNPNVRAIALCYMSSLRIEQGRFEEAYALSRRAVAASAEPPTFFMRGRAALKLAAWRRKNGAEAEAQRLLREAGADLELIPPRASNYKQARELLQDPAFKG
ncbi:MAG: hypothetical protein NTW87_16135 [Planctomycetota bacterium]|nr:hypothetical protein [Planctomycetota bacterium]